MATMKITFFYQQRSSGWTESWYRDGVTADVALAAALAPGGYVPTRLAILGIQASLQFIRVSNIDPPRDAQFLALGDSGTGTFAGFGDQALESTEEPSNAVNVRIFATQQHWRSFLMRGIPSDAVTLSGRLAPAGRFRDRLVTWVNALRAVYGIRTTAQGATQSITAVSMLGDQLRSITVGALPLGLVLGDTIVVSGILEATPIINSNYIVTGVNGLVIRVRPHNSKIFGTPNVALGGVARLTITYPAVTGAQAITMTNRKVGRPGYQPVGRRKARQR